MTVNGFVAAYAIVVGIFMPGFWSALLAGGKAELDRRPWDMGLHLAAEFATAFLLVLSGAGGFLGLPGVPVLAPVAPGMLLYSVVDSPGLYAGLKNWPMVGMFAVLTTLTLAAILGLLLAGASSAA